MKGPDPGSETSGPSRPEGVTEREAAKRARAERTIGRVRRALLDRGITPGGADRVAEACRRAMSPRIAGAHALASDKHPDLLHPGRTVLILLDDLEDLDLRVLATGALAESRDPRLRVEPSEAAALLGRMPGAGSPQGPQSEVGDRAPDDRAFTWWSDLPMPIWRPPDGGPVAAEDDATLLERIVVADRQVQRVVLADALDVIRHAHLRVEARERRRARELVERVFRPVAGRVHGVLDRRFGWWLDRVGRALG